MIGAGAKFGYSRIKKPRQLAPLYGTQLVTPPRLAAAFAIAACNRCCPFTSASTAAGVELRAADGFDERQYGGADFRRQLGPRRDDGG